MSHPPLRVGVLGAGTVGRAVIAALATDADRLEIAAGRPVCLSAVAVRDLAKARSAGVPEGLLTDAPAHLVSDPGIDVVVELMGGVEPARTLIGAALGAGKPVVTANKAVIAHHGQALEDAARRSGAALRFEAAVGGGIPVLGPIAADLAGSRIDAVRGIVNGTTNHILTAMAGEGRSYDDVLRDAQELGYAEADPTGDVEGDDAVNKLVILARLAFDAWLDPTSVGRRPPTLGGLGAPGITGITDAALRGAAQEGLTIKLLASARRRDDGIEAAVLPTAISSRSALGATDGVTNRIEIEASPLGVVGFSGPGAGGAATSSAVLGDLVAVARGMGSTWAGRPPASGPGPALDPLERAMPWLSVPVGGDAIRTGRLSIADARAAVSATTSAAEPELPLYPIDA